MRGRNMETGVRVPQKPGRRRLEWVWRGILGRWRKSGGHGLSSPTCPRDRRGWPLLGTSGQEAAAGMRSAGCPGSPRASRMSCPGSPGLGPPSPPLPRAELGAAVGGAGLSHQPWGAGMNQHPHLPRWAQCVDVTSAAGAPGPAGRHRAQSHPGPGPAVTLAASPHSGLSWGHQAGGP